MLHLSKILRLRALLRDLFHYENKGNGPGRNTCQKRLLEKLLTSRCCRGGGYKVSEQSGIAASKGNTILGLIKRTITYKEKQLLVPVYKAIAFEMLHSSMEIK